MDLENKYRLRVENCIGTIIDVHKAIGNEYENKEFLSQFEALKQTIKGLDMGLVHEGDIYILEHATNVLLGQFKPIFETKDFGQVYEEQKN
jgi:DNA-binding FrmR family transcriptional regulator